MRSILDATSPERIFQHSVKGPPKPGFSNRVLESGGIIRGYLLYVPHDYNAGNPTPLVISLHGFASNANGQRYISRWEKLAEKENFLVVYPQGTGSPLRWNSSNDFGIGAVDDVAFIRSLLSELNQLLSIAQDRIYINGMSNGGAMTARLAYEIRGIFAAAGIVSAPPISLTTNGNYPLHPVPMIAFYGTADPLVRYDGGTTSTSMITRLIKLPAHRITFPPVRPWIEAWAKCNGCHPVPEQLPPEGDTHAVRFMGCEKDAEVIFYTITGGGHTWPGGSPTFVGRTSRSIHATAKMWVFFKNHPLPHPGRTYPADDEAHLPAHHPGEEKASL